MRRRRALQAGHAAASPARRSEDGAALHKLLLSAFLELYCAHQPSALMLLDCISDFRRRQGIADTGSRGGKTPWAREGAPALVRLLIYAEAEARDSFDDRRCAEDLGACIANLTAAYGLSRAALYRGKA